jgi:hypothetical protein
MQPRAHPGSWSPAASMHFATQLSVDGSVSDAAWHASSLEFQAFQAHLTRALLSAHSQELHPQPEATAPFARSMIATVRYRMHFSIANLRSTGRSRSLYADLSTAQDCTQMCQPDLKTCCCFGCSCLGCSRLRCLQHKRTTSALAVEQVDRPNRYPVKMTRRMVITFKHKAE